MKINCKKIPKILNNFLSYLINNKNYSINTVNGYCLDILCFFEFLKKYFKTPTINIFILFRVKSKDIISYLLYLNYTKNNTSVTRQRKLSAIKLFYKWLFANFPKNNFKNPTVDIGSMKKIVRIPKYLSLQQAQKIISIFNFDNCKNPLRNNTIIRVFLNCGLRLSELINMKIEDINFYNKTIKIIGKGNKERTVFLNSGTLTALENYLKTRKITSVKEPVFVGRNNTKLSKRSVEVICKNAFKLMGLEEYHYNAHTLRHTSATILYKYVKKDILLLKEYLGHSSVEATMIYLHTDNEDIKNATEKNPLNYIA